MKIKLQHIIGLVSLSFLSACSSGQYDSSSVNPLDSNMDLSMQDMKILQSNQQVNLTPFVAATVAKHARDHDDAAYFYLQALLVDPKSRYVAERAFYELVQAEKMDEAVHLSRKLVAGDGNDLVHLIHTLGAFRSGDMEITRARLDLMPKQGFSFILSPIVRAWSYAADKDIEAARIALKPLTDDPKLSTIGLAHLGYVADFLGETKLAEESLLKLINGEDNISLQPVITYADLLMRNGRADEARDLLKKQVEHFRNNRFLLREGMRILGGQEPRQKIRSVEDGVGMLFYRLGSEFEQSRNFGNALIYLNVAFYMMPNAGDIQMMQGGLLEKMERYGAAADKYGTIAPSNMMYPLSFMRHVTVLKRDGKHDVALSMLEKALVESPNSRSLLEAVGDIHRENEDYDQALVYYDRILNTLRNLVYNDWFTFFSRGVVNEQLGNWAKAEADLLQSLKLAPKQPAILNYLGYSWIDRGVRINEARTMIEKAVASRPNDGFIIDSLGWVYFLTGDHELAVTTLEKAVKIEPMDATINDHLGDAYWQVGRKLEARFQWRHVLENDPEEELRKSVEKKLAFGLEAKK